MAFHHSQNQFYQQMVDGTGLLMQSPQELQQGYGTANHDQVSKCQVKSERIDVAYIVGLKCRNQDSKV